MKDDIRIQRSFGASELNRIRELRFEILRKPLGMPPTGSIFPGDEDESTLHLLALSGGLLVGCATLLIDDSASIQLRGMAVASKWQRMKIGEKILNAAKEEAISEGKDLWCNARFSAIGFYEHQGWTKSGELFEVPTIGPHIVMKWWRSSRNGVL